MKRTLSAGVAAGALAALLVGVPWFLLQFTSVAHLLNANWLTALTVGADSRLILALLSAVAWAAWAVVAITVVFELVAVLSRQRIQLRLPGTGWLRPAIGALVLAAIVAPGAAMADPGQSPPSRTAQLPQVASSTASAQGPTASAVATETGRSYAVQPGDELWSIAEQELGSGDRWRDIVALNDGLSETSRLVPGSMLLLPEDPAPTASVVVEKGDTLWHIAESELGDPTRWPELHAANAEQIPDPDQIEVGWELQLPAGVFQASAPVADPATEESTTVQEVAPTTPEQAAEEAFGPGVPEPTQIEDVSPTTPAPLASENSGHGDESTEISATSDADSDASTAEDYSEMLTPVGAALAGSVLLGVATRRRTQLLARAVGRRLIPVPVQVARFWTALAQHADVDAPTPQSDGPTTVVLGWDGEDPVELDIEAERAALFTGDASGAALGAMITSLSCDPSSSPVQIVVVGGPDWVHALDDPRIQGEDTTQAGLDHLTRLCSERRLAMRERTLASVRADDNLTEAFAPTVVVFLSPLGPAALDVVGDALALGEVGVSVVAACTSPAHLPYAHVEAQSKTASFRGLQFAPQLVTVPARRALISLFSSTGRIDTEPAPWWKDNDDLPPNVHPLPRQDSPEERPMTMLLAPPSSPLLSLLGTVELLGATGTLPSRALGQCMEYCAWLLQNPGATPTRMLRDLQVADTTRRSNMSRLRSWLGSDPDGSPYLPDAYSGRISLDDRVTSDWEQFTALMAGGVNTASDEALRTALSLVSGEPLGTFAFQWHWAQQLRADMTSMIVDAACVLADRALAHNDPTEASWALNQGLLGAPSDDALAVRKIECSALSGNQAETEHAVVRLNRSLRSESRDLEPALALRIQAALRPRAQRAMSAVD